MSQATIHVRFFARLREELGVSSLEVPFDSAPDLEGLTNWLTLSYPHWQSIFSGPMLKAVNQTMTRQNQALQPGDEVAFFPPVTGG